MVVTSATLKRHTGISRPILLIIFAAILFVGTAGFVAAHSGFPTPTYPKNQYGMQTTWYSGSNGAQHIYGAHSYFPNNYGYRPYGMRSYGYFYTPNDLRYGSTMRGSRSSGFVTW